MKNWDLTKIENGGLRLNDWLSDVMGLVDGSLIYSTLFKYPEEGPKDYELLMGTFPQENFRTLARFTVFTDDVPGQTVQQANFLADSKISILNSVSITGISDTTIVWNIIAELNFAGEGELIKEKFRKLKAKGDKSVNKIQHISISPAGISRIFRTESEKSSIKTELRKGTPIKIENGFIDLKQQYGDILKDIDGKEVEVTLDSNSWLISIVFFKPKTDLVRIRLTVPDCIGSVATALTMLSESKINFISVFTKVMIAHQTMDIEVIADIKNWEGSIEDLKEKYQKDLSERNGIFEIKTFERL